MASKNFYITRTQGEWVALERIAIASGKSNILSLFRAEISKLIKKIEQEDHFKHVCGDREEKKIYVDEDTYECLERLSYKMKKPVGSVVDEFIISPLLNKTPRKNEV